MPKFPKAIFVSFTGIVGELEELLISFGVLTGATAASASTKS
jgi:hypothetical protein